MNSRTWFKNCIAIILAALLLCAFLVAWLDPFFHFHAPVEGFYYTLDEQRMMNNGITRHLDYDAIITGTSMTENFKASEFDELFGVKSIKIPYAGATFKELNDNLEIAFATHKDLRVVVRGLDLSMVAHDPEALREDMGTYPDYLYDNNPVNDVKYLFNRDAIARYCGVMLVQKMRGVPGGITSFDDYSFTGDNFAYDKITAFSGPVAFGAPAKQVALTEEERKNAMTNIQDYVIALAASHPECDFYYFIPPYSMVYWGREMESGNLERALALHRLLVTEVAKVPNIHLYAFGDRLDITAELTNYHDPGHYGPWINSMMLESMKAGTGRITKENAEAYLDTFETLVREYDYASLVEQALE
ncbi:MAG: hypothetical protein IJR58_08395 [Lachnospiraceae bacterium]|nr:hypothetical protein [Lachnospiraceae bacterium]